MRGVADMEDDFLKVWFAGFNSGLEKMDETNLSAFLGECGKACSDSFPRQMYVEEYEKATDFDDFLKRIKSRMEGIDFEKNKDGSIVVVYPQCYCDLVTRGFVRSPKLCECSRRSLLYNWEAIYGEGNVEVTLLQSILQGKDTCRLLVRLDRSFGCD